MLAHRPKIVVLSLFILFGICLLMPSVQPRARNTPPEPSKSEAKSKSPAEVDARVAGMSDEQVRQAYTQKLKQETFAQPGSDPTREEENTWVAVSETFYKAAGSAAAILGYLRGAFSGEPKAAGQWQAAVALLSDGKGALYLLSTVLGLVIIIAVGLTVRHLFRRSTAAIQENIIKAVRLGEHTGLATENR